MLSNHRRNRLKEIPLEISLAVLQKYWEDMMPRHTTRKVELYGKRCEAYYMYRVQKKTQLEISQHFKRSQTQIGLWIRFVDRSLEFKTINMLKWHMEMTLRSWGFVDGDTSIQAAQ